MNKSRIIAWLFVAVLCLVLPAAAQAQSVIAGVVKDASGAVMPGVTVEAASDALIEKVRSVVTDHAGQYKIVDLRPGAYSITFTLAGFNTFKRDGLELPSAFTATVNAELRVGTVEETVTVTGESPVVDVQSTVHTQVLNRDTLDLIPTGRTIQGLGQTVVGISLSIPDVGGSRAMQQTYMSTHGMTTANTTVLVDGMMVNGLQADGAVQSYFNDSMSQEVSYQTSGIGAETSAGGVKLNMIPREGGNRVSGSFYSSWRDGAWQADNFTDDLKARGLANPSAIDRIYDFNFAMGGPLKQDKLWYFTSLRKWSVNAPIAGTFVSDGSSAGFNACLKNPSNCDQGIDDQAIKSGLVRMTWQMNTKNKISGYFDEVDKFRGHAMFAGDDYDTASVVWNSPAYHTTALKWTSTMSNRLLLEAGWSNNTENYTNEAQPGLERQAGTAEWFANASRSDLDLVSRTSFPSLASVSTQSPVRFAYQGSASYVTGSHNMKFGIQRTFGRFQHTRHGNADLVQQYRSNTTGIPFTVPDTVVVYNTPYASREDLNTDIGIYAQDQWTLKRLTLNYGLRWEHVRGSIPDQKREIGRFVPVAKDIPGIDDLPNWSDFAPRFGMAYDLFGNGKTALKYSLNRYNLARTTGVADTYNVLASTTATLTWRDLNGNDIAEGSLGCVYQTSGCEINFAGLPANFGTAATARYSQDTERTYNVEHGLEVQHELFPRVSVTGSWYFGKFHDLTFRDNQNISLNDWTPVTVFNPIDGSPLTIYNFNYGTGGPSGSRKPAIDNLDTKATHDRSQKYSAYALNFNARLPHGASVFGGFAFERQLINTCDEPDNPNQLRFCNDEDLEGGFNIPYRGQYKVAGSAPLMWGIHVAAVFQSIPGYPNRSLTTTRGTSTTANSGGTSWLLSPTTRYPATCPGCPNGVAPWQPNQVVIPNLRGTPNSTNLTVLLVPYGAEVDGNFTDRINQVDLRFTKAINFGRFRVSPQVEIFNLFNSPSVILYRSTSYATSTYNQPSGILNGRILGLGLQARW